MAIGLGLAGIFLLPLLIIRDQISITSCLIGALFCTEMMVAALWSVPMHIAPRFAGIASGMMNCGYGLAGIISPVVFGYIVDRTGDWQLPFAISIGLLFVGAVLTFWMRPDQEFVDPNEASRANDHLDVGSAKPIEGRT
jgi:cyanate permease